MKLENLLGNGYSLARELGYQVASAATAATILFTPAVMYAQQADRVDVTVKDGQADVQPEGDALAQAPAGKDPAAGKVKVKKKATPVCDSGHLDLCAEEVTCTTAGGHFYDSNSDGTATCNAEKQPEPACGPDYLGSCREQDPCTAAGGHFYDSNGDGTATCNVRPQDSDGDGVNDDRDRCADTPADTTVNGRGCPDADNDGVADGNDRCPDTYILDSVDDYGCSDDQRAWQELERQREAEAAGIPWYLFGVAEALELSGNPIDGDDMMFNYGAGAGLNVSESWDVEGAVGGFYRNGDLSDHQSGSPVTAEPTIEERLLPDGTTYKRTEESATTTRSVTETDSNQGVFGRVRAGYDVLAGLLRAFAGVDVRVGERETEVRTITDYEKITSLSRNDRPLRDPKTIRDSTSSVESDSEHTIGLYPHGGLQLCGGSRSVVGCASGQVGYDLETEQVNYGLGLRLEF